MLFRALALVLFLVAVKPTHGQEAFGSQSDLRDRDATQVAPHSAWLDLRQNAGAYSTPQQAPSWVESVGLVTTPSREGEGARTTFRIRVARPALELNMLLLRLFFDDKPEQRPVVTAWDESGTQVIQSGPLGAGIGLPTSDTVLVPMIGVSCIDVEVAGDGKTVRGAFLDWMTSRVVAHPLSAETQDVIPQPFANTAPLRTQETDSERFGTVTATLAPEAIRFGAGIPQGATFQFGIESVPLLAVLSFEVSTASVDSPPEVFVNGTSLGPASVVLPDLADPGFQGEAERLIGPMRFRYTGWLRAQKVIPAQHFRAGMNELRVSGAPGTSDSAMRATQIQLKYLWEKSDYLLQTGP